MARMKLIAGFGLLLLAGCSTAPIADFLDLVKPGRLRPGTVAPYGGVEPSAVQVPPVPVMPAPAVAPAPPAVPPGIY